MTNTYEIIKNYSLPKFKTRKRKEDYNIRYAVNDYGVKTLMYYLYNIGVIDRGEAKQYNKKEKGKEIIICGDGYTHENNYYFMKKHVKKSENIGLLYFDMHCDYNRRLLHLGIIYANHLTWTLKKFPNVKVGMIGLNDYNQRFYNSKTYEMIRDDITLMPKEHKSRTRLLTNDSKKNFEELLDWLGEDVCVTIDLDVLKPQTYYSYNDEWLLTEELVKKEKIRKHPLTKRLFYSPYIDFKLWQNIEGMNLQQLIEYIRIIDKEKNVKFIDICGQNTKNPSLDAGLVAILVNFYTKRLGWKALMKRLTDKNRFYLPRWKKKLLKKTNNLSVLS